MTTPRIEPVVTEREIINTRDIPYPRAAVFEAWTDPNQWRLWWGPKGFTNTLHEFMAQPGATWRYTMHGPNGANYPNETVLEELTPPERIILRHASKPCFRLTAGFEDREGQTRITFQQTFDTAADCSQVKGFAVEANEENLDRLTERVKLIAADPKAFVLTREFSQPPEALYRAWTDPTQMAAWWGPATFSNPVCELDVRPGGALKIVMRAPDGMDYPFKGIFREVVPFKRLAYINDMSEHGDAWHTRVNALRPNAQGKNIANVLTTVDFAPAGTGTALHIRMTFDSAEDRNALMALGMPEGWWQSLEDLDQLK